MTDKPRRRRFRPSEYVAILARQGYRCSVCREPLNGQPIEYDHVRALALLGEDSPSNLRALCAPCHAIKTRADVASIAKAKRMHLMHETGRSSAKKHVQKIPSRGFDKRLRKRMDGSVAARKEDRHA